MLFYRVLWVGALGRAVWSGREEGARGPLWSAILPHDAASPVMDETAQSAPLAVLEQFNWGLNQSIFIMFCGVSTFFSL